MSQPSSPPIRWVDMGLHAIAKPIGPICNLDCTYCFYLQKEALYPKHERWKMSDETLAANVRQYIEAQPETAEEINFAFQGGEPTLMGLDWFRRVLELQRQYARPGKRITNSLQTNGVLLDDPWCEFLKSNDFLVGLSIDGPADLHDVYRRDKKGGPSFQRVTAALQCLKKHGVEFNALCCVHRKNADHPGRVYRFFRDSGVQFIQFIPIVQRLPGVALQGDPGEAAPESLVSPMSVLPQQYGRFLKEIFEIWVRQDVGRIFVRDFDQALASWLGVGASLCVYAKHCGRATAIEHNGDLYSCDHYVEPDYRLGNIHDASIAALVNSPRQEKFGHDKEATLPDYCRQCSVRFACNGGCPKDRFWKTPDGQQGLNYLCAGYKIFFNSIDPLMRQMAESLHAGEEAAVVMHRLRAQQHEARGQAAGRSVGRNDPCPCGSGKKFKSCCMRGTK